MHLDEFAPVGRRPVSVRDGRPQGGCRITSAATTGSCETNCWKGKRLTRCSRPRCSSNGGGSTTTRSDRTVPWDTGPRPQRRGSPERSHGVRRANARGWSTVGGQNPNLRTGVIHGGRSTSLATSYDSACGPPNSSILLGLAPIPDVESLTSLVEGHHLWPVFC